MNHPYETAVARMAVEPRLSFGTLRAANEARLPLFKNAHGSTVHSGRDWFEDDWSVAILGEVGELANLYKKIRRNDMSVSEARGLLSREMSDIVIYADLMAAHLEVGLVRDDTVTVYMVQDRASRRMISETRRVGTMRRVGRLAVTVGKIVAHLDLIDSGHTPPSTLAPVIQSELSELIHQVAALAELASIRLDAAIMETFNAKSEQLSLPLFLSPNGVVTDRK